MNIPEVGKLTICHNGDYVAGTLTTVEFRYTVGPGGLPSGARLRVGLPNVAWYRPEVPQYYFWSQFARGRDRQYTQYDRVNTTSRIISDTAATPLLDAQARFHMPFSFPHDWRDEYDRYWITVTIEEDNVVEGDTIIITYGDPAEKPLTARVQSLPEENITFRAFIDRHGEDQFAEVAGSPHRIDVVPGQHCRIDAIAPSIIRPNELPSIRVAYTDAVKVSPRPLPYVGTIEVAEDSNDSAESRKVDSHRDSVIIDGPATNNATTDSLVRRLTVRDCESGYTARTNPIITRENGPRLFWGDLHAQSQFHCWNPQIQKGIGCNLPRECYRYARDIAGLDFCAITDAQGIALESWATTIDQANEMNEPGQFVAFQAAEVGDDTNGHRNLIFRTGVPEPPIKASTQDGDRPGLVELHTTRMQARYKDRDDVILVPHHVKMWLNWDVHEPCIEPVMEIYSIWGSGEKAGTDLWNLREVTGGCQEAWARGYKMGVIAGSDTHAGLPGRSLAASDRADFLEFKGGIAGVWANELTREGIFDAVKARRCYGTTGVRIILETFIDDHPMGSAIPWPDRQRPREIRIVAAGTTDIDTITIVKNNEDVYCVRVGTEQTELAWTDSATAQSGDFYYVRVTQRDNERAWSSPIWLE